MRSEDKPWGRFEVLHETDTTWLKRIIIKPGQSLSYQYHFNRTEYWTPETKGVWAEVKGRQFELTPFAAACVVYPRQGHRLFNPGLQAVSVLEWVVGSPDETDIVRVRDDYGRETK